MSRYGFWVGILLIAAAAFQCADYTLSTWVSFILERRWEAPTWLCLVALVLNVGWFLGAGITWLCLSTGLITQF